MSQRIREFKQERERLLGRPGSPGRVRPQWLLAAVSGMRVTARCCLRFIL